MNPVIISLVAKLTNKYLDRDKGEDFLKEFENNANLLERELIQTQGKIITKEASGGFLQRNWRPLLMLTAILIIFNNYVVFPYARAFGLALPLLDLPAGLWALLTTGVGGYVVGRSAEKMMGGIDGQR